MERVSHDDYCQNLFARFRLSSWSFLVPSPAVEREKKSCRPAKNSLSVSDELHFAFELKGQDVAGANQGASSVCPAGRRLYSQVRIFCSQTRYIPMASSPQKLRQVTRSFKSLYPHSFRMQPLETGHYILHKVSFSFSLHFSVDPNFDIADPVLSTWINRQIRPRMKSLPGFVGFCE